MSYNKKKQERKNEMISHLGKIQERKKEKEMSVDVCDTIYFTIKIMKKGTIILLVKRNDEREK